MQNETQNQNIGAQEAKEEAPVQTETQEQNIGAQEQSSRFEAAAPPAQEEGLNPADATDPKVTMSSEDLVGPDPKVTMNPQDLSGQETPQEGPGFVDQGISDFWDAPGNPENPSDSLPGDGIDWGPFSWGEDDAWGGCGTFPSEDPSSWPFDLEDPTWTDPLPTEPTNTGVVPPGLQEPSNPLPTEPGDPDWNDGSGEGSDEDATPGGYDGSGIAGGLDLDGNGVFDRSENNPDMSDDDEKHYTYDEGAYKDAQDAFEDLQDALQDGDEEDRAEALEELRDYLNGFDKNNQDQENDSHNPGVQEDEHDDENESPKEAGINPDISDDKDHNEQEEYTYDADAYEDAEGALKDLQHALKHGDEHERAEALEKLQGYLGGFDKGNEEDHDLTGVDPE